jgi:Holliday junction resolvasome RuvABC ATP-dependent DNA helicase subunit
MHRIPATLIAKHQDQIVLFVKIPRKTARIARRMLRRIRETRGVSPAPRR